MAPATEGKSLENNLKKAALACANTLTPATGFQPKDPPPKNAESLGDKVRRVRQEGSVYKYEDSKDESATETSMSYLLSEITKT